jgi:hypothetical protein
LTIYSGIFYFYFYSPSENKMLVEGNFTPDGRQLYSGRIEDEFSGANADGLFTSQKPALFHNSGARFGAVQWIGWGLSSVGRASRSQ